MKSHIYLCGNKQTTNFCKFLVTICFKKMTEIVSKVIKDNQLASRNITFLEMCDDTRIIGIKQMLVHCSDVRLYYTASLWICPYPHTF
jgi:hypothetical protein